MVSLWIITNKYSRSCEERRWLSSLRLSNIHVKVRSSIWELYIKCKVLGEENCYRLHKDVTFFCSLKNGLGSFLFSLLVIHTIFGNTWGVHDNIDYNLVVKLVWWSAGCGVVTAVVAMPPKAVASLRWSSVKILDCSFMKVGSKWFSRHRMFKILCLLTCSS